MRNIKKILCLVITIVMIASTVSVFAAFSDVSSSDSYSEAVSALNQLGIINGYEDGTFLPDNYVTRAEFTAMLMRTMGAGSVGATSASGLPFSDLSDDNSDVSWAYPNINTAYSNGIINGYEDGTFRPSDTVLYEEAVKMVVCALGYGSDISVDVEPWYSNFIAQAASLGITKKAQNLGSVGSPASRACIAQMLYDSLEVNLVENGYISTKTFLSDYLGYIKNTGYISANDLTSLDDPDVSLRDNQIQIRAKEPGSSTYEVHTYTVSDASEFKNMLGYQIVYFYPDTNDTVRELFSYDIQDHKSLELDDSMIEAEDCSNTLIKYYPDPTSNIASASLASDNVVIYNGKLYGSDASSSTFSTDMLPNVGTVTLLDGDNDGKYETITIWDYELYYVSSKSSSDYSIVDNMTRVSDKTLTLDVDADSNLDLVNTSGTAVTFSSISTGNVICYAESKDDNGGTIHKTAVVVTNSVTGSVSSVVNGEDITIAGTTYDFSSAAPWMENGNDNSSLTQPTAGDSGTYALDLLGRVFAYSKSSTTSSMYYGYLLAYDQGDTFASLSDLKLRVLTENNSKVDYGIKSGTTINGVSYSTQDDFLAALYDSAAFQKTGESGTTPIQQVIKYTTTTSGSSTYLDTIYTVTDSSFISGGQTVENDVLYNLADLNYGNVSMTYSNSRLSNTSVGVQLSISSAVVFVVPDQDSRSSSDNFKKTTASSYFSSNKTYESVEAFDVSKTNTAKVIVVYGGSTSTEVDDTSPLCVVEDVYTEQNDGTLMYKLDGYKVTRSSTTGTYSDQWISSQSSKVAASLATGDIYRVGEDSDGYLTFDSDYCLYPSDDGYVDTASLSRWNTADYCVIYGSVYAADSTEAVVVIPEILTADDDYSSYDQYTISASSFSGAKILQYDTSSRGTVTITDSSDDRDAVIDSLSELVEGLDPSHVLLYLYEGRVKLMVVTEV